MTSQHNREKRLSLKRSSSSIQARSDFWSRSQNKNASKNESLQRSSGTYATTTSRSESSSTITRQGQVAGGSGSYRSVSGSSRAAPSLRSSGGGNISSRNAKGSWQTLGHLLPRCLSDLQAVRPSDTNEYMAQWLYRAVDAGLARDREHAYLRDTAAYMKDIRAEKAKTMNELRHHIKQAKEMLGEESPKKKKDSDIRSMIERFRARQREFYEEHVREIKPLGVRIVTDPKKRQSSVRSNSEKRYDSEWRLIDQNGRLIDDNGRLIDENGRLIDPKGRLIDELGRLVDTFDFEFDENGRLIDKSGAFIDQNGRLIDESGRLIDKNDFQFDENGRLIDNNDRLIDQKRRLIDKCGRLIDENGRLIDESGRLIDKIGRLIDNYGRLIDGKGSLSDEKGRLIERSGGLIDQQGNLIDESDRLIQESGRLIDESGNLIYNNDFKFDDNRRLIDHNGRLIDHNGRLIDQKGRLSDESGRLIEDNDFKFDENGRLFDKEGRLINSSGRFIDAKGRIINEKGQLIDEQGRLVNEKGMLINEKGQLIDEEGRLVNEEGRLIDDEGRLIDSEGYLIYEDGRRTTLQPDRLRFMLRTWLKNTTSKTSHPWIKNTTSKITNLKSPEKDVPKTPSDPELKEMRIKEVIHKISLLKKDKEKDKVREQSARQFGLIGGLTMNEIVDGVTAVHKTKSAPSTSRMDASVVLRKCHSSNLETHRKFTENNIDEESMENFVCQSEYNPEYYTVCGREAFDYETAGVKPMTLDDYDLFDKRHADPELPQRVRDSVW